MMQDLFSDLPFSEVDANYATRKVHQWIVGDPALDEQCRDCALESMERGDRAWRQEDIVSLAAADLMLRLAEDLRTLVVASALDTERAGFFFYLFTEGLKEVDWSALGTFYLDIVADES
jgi:hypothetical protein